MARKALEDGAVVVDIRCADSRDAPGGSVEVVAGALSIPWSTAEGAMQVSALPADKDTLIVLHCAGGSRAEKAAAFLAEKHGYTNIINGGGPANAELWPAFRAAGRSLHTHTQHFLSLSLSSEGVGILL